MLKSARAASLAPGALDGPHSDTYQEMYDQQLALTLSKGKGIGIAEMLVRQLQSTLPGAAQAAPGVPGALHVMPEPSHVIRPTPQKNDAIISSSTATPAVAFPLPTTAAPEDTETNGDSSSTTTESVSQPHTPQEFVASVWPAARAAAQELGVDPKVLVAQAAVESGWGRSVAHLSDGRSSHNLFGIKADERWNGQRTVVSTLEYQDGIPVRRQDPFRAYGSFSDSFADYAHFLRSNPRYQAALNQASDPDAFLSGLQAAGYATDPAYAHKVASVLHGDTLQTALDNLGGA